MISEYVCFHFQTAFQHIMRLRSSFSKRNFEIGKPDKKCKLGISIKPLKPKWFKLDNNLETHLLSLDRVYLLIFCCKKISLSHLRLTLYSSEKGFKDDYNCKIIKTDLQVTFICSLLLLCKVYSRSFRKRSRIGVQSGLEKEGYKERAKKTYLTPVFLSKVASES